jgi:hypothetical protein
MSNWETDLLGTLKQIAAGYDENKKLKRLLTKSFAKVGLQSLDRFLEHAEEQAETAELSTAISDTRDSLIELFFSTDILGSSDINLIMRKLEPLFQKADLNDVEYWLDHQEAQHDEYTIEQLKRAIYQYYKGNRTHGRKSTSPPRMDPRDAYTPVKDIEVQEYNDGLVNMKRDRVNRFKSDLEHITRTLEGFYKKNYCHWKNIESQFETVGEAQQLISDDDVQALGKIFKTMGKYIVDTPICKSIKKSSTKRTSTKKSANKSTKKSANGPKREGLQKLTVTKPTDYDIFNKVFEKLQDEAPLI